MGRHWQRWWLVYVCLAVGLSLYSLNQWAGAQNAVRDAGLTWLDVTSPRSRQTYSVRAQVAHGWLQAFTLEAGQGYVFPHCALPTPGNLTTCTDQAGQPWEIAP